MTATSVYWIGLFDANRREINGDGYERQSVEFKPISEFEATNIDPVKFVAHAEWLSVRSWAIFKNKDDRKPLSGPFEFAFNKTAGDGDELTVSDIHVLGESVSSCKQRKRKAVK